MEESMRVSSRFEHLFAEQRRPSISAAGQDQIEASCGGKRSRLPSEPRRPARRDHDSPHQECLQPQTNLGQLIDSSDFPFDLAREVAWFERSDAELCVPEIVAQHKLPEAYEAHLRHFLKNGYIILDNFITRKQCDRINSDLDALIGSGNFRYEFKGQRIENMFAHSRSAV